MSNTFSSTLKPASLADGLITIGNNRLAKLNAFTTKFTADRLRPGASLVIPLATGGSVGQSNPTNLESGDGVVGPITVTMTHVTQSFHLSIADRNNGFTLEHLAPVNVNLFADAISDVITPLMTVANFGAAIPVGVAATFNGGSLSPVLAAAKNYRSKNLLLDGGHLAYIAPSDKMSFRLGEEGAWGFDLLAEHNRWTSAASGIVGFSCSPESIAIGAGLPATPDTRALDESGTVTLANGLSVGYKVWFNTATGVQWAMFETMLGAGVGDTTQGKILTT